MCLGMFRIGERGYVVGIECYPHEGDVLFMQHLRPRKQNRFDILQSSISYYQGSEGKRTLCPQNVRVRYAAPHLRLHSAIRILQNSFYPGVG